MIAVDRVCRWFFRFGRNRFVPGRHLTDHQMRLYMKFRQTNPNGRRGGEGVHQYCHGVSYREGSEAALAEGSARTQTA